MGDTSEYVVTIDQDLNYTFLLDESDADTVDAVPVAPAIPAELSVAEPTVYGLDVQVEFTGRAEGGGSADGNPGAGDGEPGYVAVAWAGEDYDPGSTEQISIPTVNYDESGRWVTTGSHSYEAAGEYQIRAFYSGLEETRAVTVAEPPAK